MKHLEQFLNSLRVKPRFGFKLILKMKLYLRMWQMSSFQFKFAGSLAVLAIFVLGIFGGTRIFPASPGYAYFASQAYDDLDELSALLDGKIATHRVIPLAQANSGIDEERVRFLTARIMLFSALALEEADDITDFVSLNAALLELSYLQRDELVIFGGAVEKVSSDDTLVILSSAIETTFQNSVEVQNAVLQAGKIAGDEQNRLDFTPKLLAASKVSKSARHISDESISRTQKILSEAAQTFNIEQTQQNAEDDLKKIVFAPEKNASSAKLSRRYLKAITEMEAQNSIKANALFNSVEKESRYLALVQGEEATVSAVSVPVDATISEPTESVQDSAITDSSVRDDDLDQLLTGEEQIELVGKLLKSKEEPVTEASSDIVGTPEPGDTATESSSSAASSTAAPITSAKPVEPIYAEKEVQLEDKIKLFKEEKELQRIDEERIRIEQEKKGLEEEAKRKAEEEEHNNQEREAKLLEKQRLEAEQRRIAEEKKRIEAEQQRITVEKKQLEAQQDEAEKKRLEEERLSKEAEERAILEQLRRELEEQQRIEMERQRIEEEKRLLEEARAIKDAEQKRIQEELRLQEEEKERIRQELLKKQEELHKSQDTGATSSTAVSSAAAASPDPSTTSAPETQKTPSSTSVPETEKTPSAPSNTTLLQSAPQVQETLTAAKDAVISAPTSSGAATGSTSSTTGSLMRKR